MAKLCIVLYVKNNYSTNSLQQLPKPDLRIIQVLPFLGEFSYTTTGFLFDTAILEAFMIRMYPITELPPNCSKPICRMAPQVDGISHHLAVTLRLYRL